MKDLNKFLNIKRKNEEEYEKLLDTIASEIEQYSENIETREITLSPEQEEELAEQEERAVLLGEDFEVTVTPESLLAERMDDVETRLKNEGFKVLLIDNEDFLEFKEELLNDIYERYCISPMQMAIWAGATVRVGNIEYGYTYFAK